MSIIINVSYFIQGDEESDSDEKYVNAEEVSLEDDGSFKDKNCYPSKYTKLLQRAEHLSKLIKTLLAEAFIFENKNHLGVDSVHDLSSDYETDLSIESGLNTNGKFIESYSSMLGKKLQRKKFN